MPSTKRERRRRKRRRRKKAKKREAWETEREREKEMSDYPKTPMLTMLEATLYLCHQTIQFT